VPLIKPYVADVLVGGLWLRDLEVVDLNKTNVWVRLPNGRIIRKHLKKHANKVVLKFIDATDTVENKKIRDANYDIFDKPKPQKPLPNPLTVQRLYDKLRSGR
jgi:hypothetical protein